MNHLLLRPLLPLIAVAALAGPSSALASGLGPDLAPAGGAVAGQGLTPDPAPGAARQTSIRAAEPQPAFVAPALLHTVESPALPRRARTTRKHVRPAAAPRPIVKPARIVDVMPLQVDVHRGLGGVPEPRVDDSKLALAALALLAAVAAAASGAVLAARGRELL